MGKVHFYKAVYEIAWWFHKRWLALPNGLSARIPDPDRLRYWAQFRGCKLEGWKP